MLQQQVLKMYITQIINTYSQNIQNAVELFSGNKEIPQNIVYTVFWYNKNLKPRNLYGSRYLGFIGYYAYFISIINEYS